MGELGNRDGSDHSFLDNMVKAGVEYRYYLEEHSNKTGKVRLGKEFKATAGVTDFAGQVIEKRIRIHLIRV